MEICSKKTPFKGDMPSRVTESPIIARPSGLSIDCILERECSRFTYGSGILNLGTPFGPGIRSSTKEICIIKNAEPLFVEGNALVTKIVFVKNRCDNAHMLTEVSAHRGV